MLPTTWLPRGLSGKESVCNERRFPSLGQEDPLEKEMAAQSSILAWKIPWTENLVGYSPGGRKGLDATERLSTAQQHLWFAAAALK